MKRDSLNDSASQRERQCTCKVPFSSLTAALAGSKAMKKKFKKKFTAYHCPWCDLFHIGTRFKQSYAPMWRRDLRRK